MLKCAVSHFDMLDKNSPFATTAPRRAESLSSLALTLLGDAIVAGCPAPGALVSEVELSERFAIGLAATGWVSAEGRRGWRVLPISAEHLADLQAARTCLERVLPDHRPPRAASRGNAAPRTTAPSRVEPVQRRYAIQSGTWVVCRDGSGCCRTASAQLADR